jgi:hypothetical protein
MAQVQNYAYILVSLKQISFVLFTYSMSRKKAWVHICTETCTDGIGKWAKKREIMSVGARLSTFVFLRHYQACRTHRCRKIRNPEALISLNTEASVAKVCV